MRIARLVIAILMLVTLVGFAVPPANAAGEEACFCYLDELGATKTEGATDGLSCATVCAKIKGYSGYLWATDYAQYPAANLRCFADADQCKKDMDGDGTVDGEFGSEQPPECLLGSHYCYSASTLQTTLQVEILGRKTVVDFGDYIGLVYKYLLGFAVTIAIVFMMIGGIRYVIGASSGEIGKAKDMITKAVSGFVLLLFAWIILYTVNPELIRLQVPKLPMLKGVAFVQGDDCATLVGGDVTDSAAEIDMYLDDQDQEAIAAYGAGVRSASTGAVLKYTGRAECGTTAEVFAVQGGARALEGTTCNFGYCSGDAASCLASPGKTPECMTCKEVGPRNDLGAVPNDAVCAGLDPSDTYVGGSTTYDMYNFCGYTQDPWMFASGLGITAAATAATVATALSYGTATALVAAGYSASVAADAIYGSCAVMNIDCKKIATCEDYNGVEVANSITDTTLSYLDWDSFGDPNGVDVCNQDPCGAGAKMTTPPLAAITCAYNANTGDCRVSGYAPDTGAYTDSASF